jgi:hypothetical protein
MRNPRHVYKRKSFNTKRLRTFMSNLMRSKPCIAMEIYRVFAHWVRMDCAEQLHSFDEGCAVQRMHGATMAS